MTRIKIIFAGLLAALALGSATPAFAGTHPGKPDKVERCERKLETLEHQFRVLERIFGWEAASWWWNEIGWPRYYKQCGGV
jgi:hypothetical protein